MIEEIIALVDVPELTILRLNKSPASNETLCVKSVCDVLALDPALTTACNDVSAPFFLSVMVSVPDAVCDVLT